MIKDIITCNNLAFNFNLSPCIKMRILHYCPTRVTQAQMPRGAYGQLFTPTRRVERGWNVEMELATPAHGGYFRKPVSRVNKQLNQGWINYN